MTILIAPAWGGSDVAIELPVHTYALRPISVLSKGTVVFSPSMMISALSLKKNKNSSI
jgi:hypothetical protein